MEKLTWDIVALLLVKYGIPTADAIVRKWLSGEPVTDTQWQEVRTVASQSARDVMRKKLTEAGINPESVEGVRLLNLAG